MREVLGMKKKQKTKIGVASRESKEILIDGFEINAKFTGTSKRLIDDLSKLSFLDVVKQGKEIAAINIESRTIRKEPYMFSIIYFERNKIKFLYTVAPNISPKKRRLEVLSYFLNILTYVGDKYVIDIQEILQLLQEAIHEMSEYVSLDFEKMYAMHDALKSKIERMTNEIKNLQDSNAALSRQNYELRTKLEDIQVKYNKLKKMSDEALSEKILDWISEHDGKIDISEFSKVYGVYPTRVEQMLNTLVESRFIEPK